MTNERTISDRLLALGVKHYRTANSDATGQHILVDMATDTIMGFYRADEAVQLLNALERPCGRTAGEGDYQRRALAGQVGKP